MHVAVDIAIAFLAICILGLILGISIGIIIVISIVAGRRARAVHAPDRGTPARRASRQRAGTTQPQRGTTALSDDHERHNRAVLGRRRRRLPGGATAHVLVARRRRRGACGGSPTTTSAWSATRTASTCWSTAAARAQWSIALARDGARPVGLDQSRGQLRHARRWDRAPRRASFPLVCASGARVPLADASFDLVFCDHGAMSFCDPEATVPEVVSCCGRAGGWRSVTPPRGCTSRGTTPRPRTRRLRHPYFGIRVFDAAEGTVDFQLPTGDVDPPVPPPRPRRRRPRGAPGAERGDEHVRTGTRSGRAAGPRSRSGCCEGPDRTRPHSAGTRQNAPMTTHRYRVRTSWEGSTAVGYDAYSPRSPRRGAACDGLARPLVGPGLRR